MCYAIPGKVVSVEGRAVILDYFGERRVAHLAYGDATPGEYIYAQGGVVVGKISESEAVPILDEWKKLFFELKKIDAGMASESSKAASSSLHSILKKAEGGGALTRSEMLSVLSAESADDPVSVHRTANLIRKDRLGNACCVHGIIEFSNYCANDCLYCGIRCGNKNTVRYRMGEKEILDAVDYAAGTLGFKALVLQSGEDPHYTDDMLAGIVGKIREKHGILLFMSVGERSAECYERLYGAGAYGALIRFETSNEKIYSQVRPGKKLKDRLALIRELKRIGFVVATGFLIGLPGQTKDDLINDILLTKSLNPDMHSFGPLIPHPETPLFSQKKPSLDDVLKTIALCRLVEPESKILVTSAMEALSQDAGRRCLMAGGNSLMINATPEVYRSRYDLYPGKVRKEDVRKTVRDTLDLLYSLGRAPTDPGL